MKDVKILLVDDSDELGFLVKVCLKPYYVKQVFTVAEARLDLENNPYDLILIDATLPDGDGFKMCNDIQVEGKHKHIPKILLTARASLSDKVFGLNCGADDYITKPFASAELKARVDVKLRPALFTEGSVHRVGCFEFESDFHRCTVVGYGDSRDLQLTPTEFRIFLALVRNEGAPMSRKELVQIIWRSHGTNIEPRGIDTHIAHLRKKLGTLNGVVVSVYGKGYSFCLPDMVSNAA